LVLEPPLADEEAEHNAASVVAPPCLLGGADHIIGNDLAMRFGDAILLQLARDALFDEVAETKSDFGNFGGRNGRFETFAAVSGENWVQWYQRMPSEGGIKLRETCCRRMMGQREGE
jgi:hypothetical protein